MRKPRVIKEKHMNKSKTQKPERKLKHVRSSDWFGVPPQFVCIDGNIINLSRVLLINKHEDPKLNISRIIFDNKLSVSISNETKDKLCDYVSNGVNPVQMQLLRSDLVASSVSSPSK